MNARRILDCYASDFEQMDRKMLLQSIAAAEGRTVLVELKESFESYIKDLTNSELAVAAGADLILLNQLNVLEPVILGIDQADRPVQRLKELVGVPLGVNLEPIVPTSVQTYEPLEAMISGRKLSVETLDVIENLPLDFLCITGNPKSGVTNEGIVQSIQLAKEHYSGIIMVGKMHSAAIQEPVMTEAVAEQFVEAGADVVLLPAVGTIPGFTMEEFLACQRIIHQSGKLVMAVNGASQCCAPRDVIRQIALNSKVGGADIHHIGSSNSGGVAPFENIYELSMTIRGENHTLRQLARSIRR